MDLELTPKKKPKIIPYASTLEKIALKVFTTNVKHIVNNGSPCLGHLEEGKKPFE